MRSAIIEPIVPWIGRGVSASVLISRMSLRFHQRDSPAVHASFIRAGAARVFTKQVSK